MTLQTPNTNQATDDSLAGKMKDTLARWLRDSVDDMLPARVISYDDSTGMATVQPLVMMGTTDGTKVSRAAIASIKTLRMGAGGFFIRFPIKAGDLGWIKASDRDISLILQSSGGEDWPNTKRLHSFSDALFIPDTYKSWVIDGAHADALVIQSLDGSSCFAMGADFIELKSAGQVLRLDALGLSHNGVNVGNTHRHGGVDPGSGTSGGPQ